jgi:hypothetical protein
LRPTPRRPKSPGMASPDLFDPGTGLQADILFRVVSKRAKHSSASLDQLQRLLQLAGPYQRSPQCPHSH